MKIGIIACESFREELELLTGDDPDIIYREYLEFGLHSYPEKLKRAVRQKVEALEGNVDAVLLGYGVCSSLRDITGELRVPTVRLDADDCIGAILTNRGYADERKKCAGTLYNTPYFTRQGLEVIKRDLMNELPNWEELGIDMEWYLGKLFDGYSRVLYIDDGTGDAEKLKEMSARIADELHLRHECREGSLEVLIDALAKTKELARKKHQGC